MLNPKTCAVCRQKTMQIVTDRYCTEIKYDGRPYTIDLPELVFYRCWKCASVILPDEADEAIGIELRRVAGLLSPEQIKENRKRLNLTQKQLADSLGTAEETICRWEGGGQIQSRALDNLLQLFFESRSVRARLASRTKSIPPPRVEISRIADMNALMEHFVFAPSLERVIYTPSLINPTVSDGADQYAIAGN